MNKPKWTSDEFDSCEKEVAIYGPRGFVMMVDFDDVNHDAVERMAMRVLEILNTEWDKD